jgi:MscS family membrane protein
VIGDHEMSDAETLAVYFSGFGDSALEILVVVFLKTADFHQFMAAQQEIFLEIMRVVEDAGSAFAFPSRSLYVETPVQTRPGEPPTRP